VCAGGFDCLLPPGAEAFKRDNPRAVVRFFDARKCWRVYCGDFGTIAARSKLEEGGLIARVRGVRKAAENRQ